MLSRTRPVSRRGRGGQVRPGASARLVPLSTREKHVFETVEVQVRSYVEWLRLMVEALGDVVIGAGLGLVGLSLARHLWSGGSGSFTPIRLAFARYLTLALELQLAADILSTAVAPTWDRIGKLAAIAVIRTTLNYFLSKEIKEESAAEQGAPAGR